MTVTLVSYGGGTDSTSALLGMMDAGEQPPHAIIFSDTGDLRNGKFGEKPKTYAYIEMFSRYLVEHGYPPITMIRKGGNGRTLEEDCRIKRMLPSVAYGKKGCSQKFKIEPQEKWANNDRVCRAEWRAGRKVTKVIGYNWDEVHRARFYDDPKYEWRYPLIDWKWGREKCAAVILEHGLPLPGKSACFFCPNSKPHEIRELARQEPELLQRALDMEANARLKTVVGLGRNFRWKDVIDQGEMFPEIYDKQPNEMPCGCYDG